MSDKSVLSDEQLIRLRDEAHVKVLRETGSQSEADAASLRAVAEAAIAADRAARAETVGMPHKHPAFVSYEFRFKDSPLRWMSCDFANYRAALEYEECDARALYTAPPAAPVVPQDISPANVPMYWRDESSNACAYAAGWNACRTTMLAATAPSQEPKQ